MREKAEVVTALEQGVPEADGLSARMVKLVAELPGEAESERTQWTPATRTRRWWR